MSFDGSGNYTVPAGTQAVSGAVIDSAKYNALLTDLQTALTKCLLRDGQSAALAAISMGGFKITSLAPGVLRTDAATLGQVQDGGSGLLTSVAGSNTITASCATPQLAAYVTGLRLTLIPVADSTTAVTLNVNGLGAKTVLVGATPLGVTGLRTGVAYFLVYDGAAFQLTSALVTGYAASGANADITSLTALIGNGLLPVGTIITHAASTAPSGYLKANGALVSRSTYAALFTVIGTTFGAGNGSTTFALPDLRGEFIRGWDDARGIDSGRAIGTSQGHAVQDHTHASAAAASGQQILQGGVTGAAVAGFTTGNMNSGTSAPETRPRNIALLACIKY